MIYQLSNVETIYKLKVAFVDALAREIDTSIVRGIK
tara:strand:+ start:9 stop:116 length:108 start_codon:yes stop_codon:yes gene_type:complete